MEQLYRYINNTKNHNRAYVSMEDRYINRLNGIFTNIQNGKYWMNVRIAEAAYTSMPVGYKYYTVTNLGRSKIHSTDAYGQVITLIIQQCEDEYFEVYSIVFNQALVLCDTFDGLLDLLKNVIIY